MQMSPGPSCPNRPFSTKLGGMEINTRVRGSLAPEDVVRRVADHVYSEWLRSRMQRRWVEGDLELACPWVIDTAADGTRWLVVFDMEHREQFKELSRL
jgi:hypothetical protein